jgi:hypothetical protein
MVLFFHNSCVLCWGLCVAVCFGMIFYARAGLLVINKKLVSRLLLSIISCEGPGTYAFGYEIEDIVTGNIQFRDEVKLRNGTVKGSYGVLLPDDTLHVTRYIADHLGYR